MEERKCDIQRLDHQLCFPLYACSREMIKLYTPVLDEFGLTYTQYITMLVLWEKKVVTVKQLGEALYLDSGTLTPLLKKLEAKGLVRRTRSEEDERNLIVTLTEEGEAMKEPAEIIPKRMSQCVNLTPEEARECYRLLYKLLDFVKK